MVEQVRDFPLQRLPLPRQGDRERVQGVVRTASRPEPVGEPPKVFLINLVEDRHHELLDNLVLQRRDAQGTLPPIGLRNVDSPCGLRPIGPAVDSAMQVCKPVVQAGLILLPGHAIHPGSRMPLQRIEAAPEQVDREMVE